MRRRHRYPRYTCAQIDSTTPYDWCTISEPEFSIEADGCSRRLERRRASSPENRPTRLARLCRTLWARMPPLCKESSPCCRFDYGPTHAHDSPPCRCMAVRRAGRHCRRMHHSCSRRSRRTSDVSRAHHSAHEHWCPCCAVKPATSHSYSLFPSSSIYNPPGPLHSPTTHPASPIVHHEPPTIAGISLHSMHLLHVAAP